MMEDEPQKVDWGESQDQMKEENAKLEDDLMAVEMRLVVNLQTAMASF